MPRRSDMTLFSILFAAQSKTRTLGYNFCSEKTWKAAMSAFPGLFSLNCPKPSMLSFSRPPRYGSKGVQNQMIGQSL